MGNAHENYNSERRYQRERRFNKEKKRRDLHEGSALERSKK